jgi:hypothetical protein
MKTLSLKLDDNIFNETEVVLTNIKKSRNRYINEAVDYYNRINRMNFFAHNLVKESKLVRENPWKFLQNLKGSCLSNYNQC